jgi:hypothetical protein
VDRREPADDRGAAAVGGLVFDERGGGDEPFVADLVFLAVGETADVERDNAAGVVVDRQNRDEEILTDRRRLQEPIEQLLE